MPDIDRIFAANLLEERGHLLRGAVQGKIKAILGIKHGAGFAVNGLVRAKKSNRKLLSLIVINPGVNTLLNHQNLLVYPVAEFAGKVEEGG